MEEYNFNKANKPFVMVSLIGGFGNNLFQIALAKRLEFQGCTVRFDVSAKKYERLEVLEFDDIGEYVGNRIASWTRFVPSLIGERASLSRFIFERVFGFQTHVDLDSYGAIPPILRRKLVLTGYWQSLESAQFLGKKSFKKRQSSSKTIAVHVRRGDMKVNIDHPLDNFFKFAVTQILQENLGEEMNILVFTDDIAYCKTELDLGFKFIASVGNSTLQDFREMAECDFLVISRSTYSWWAAFLSSGKVYCPTPWDLGKKFNNTQMIPIQWVTIETEK